MIELKNIHSLSDFKRNAKEFIEQIKTTKSPLVLKLATLQQDINLGISQIKDGDYTEYDADTLPNLIENIKTRGQKRLLQSKNESI